MSVLSRFGVTVETPDKFQDPAAGSGRVLLLDGDGTCYQATATAKKLDTAMRRFEQQVLDGYRKINQNILPEAEALWLLRWEGDSAYNFLKELNLSPANLDFLEDCYNQDWRRDEYHEPEE